MKYMKHYGSPLGSIYLTADEEGLTGLIFDREESCYNTLSRGITESNNPFLCESVRWLDLYFSGSEPDFLPHIHLTGTKFQMTVWNILQQIPYGNTITYGEIARQIEKQNAIKKMSAQAVGGAVGRNKISIIIPCHRVIGVNGRLTGYAGGLDKKIALLKLENANMNFTV